MLKISILFLATIKHTTLMKFTIGIDKHILMGMYYCNDGSPDETEIISQMGSKDLDLNCIKEMVV
jgi:hypothetical protein